MSKIEVRRNERQGFGKTAGVTYEEFEIIMPKEHFEEDVNLAVNQLMFHVWFMKIPMIKLILSRNYFELYFKHMLNRKELFINQGVDIPEINMKELITKLIEDKRGYVSKFHYPMGYQVDIELIPSEVLENEVLFCNAPIKLTLT